MSWIDSHSKSEYFASEAEVEMANGNQEKAAELYKEAARLETEAINELDNSKPRTLGITYISSASLWFKGNDLAKSEMIAFHGLSSIDVPEFAKTKLREIVQTIWNERSMRSSGIEFTKASVVISVKGGEIVHGGAPIELILAKVDQVGKMFYRIVEMKLNKPFRKQGPPSQEIQDQFKPWLFQAPPGSYQFAVRVEKPKQPSLFADNTPNADEIAETFLDVVKNSVEDPDGELKQIVPSDEYRDVLLRLTRNLIPSGKVFDTLEIHAPESPEYKTIVLKPYSRDSISSSLSAAAKGKKATSKNIEQILGILKGLSLNKNYLEINIIENDVEKTLFIRNTGEAIDDVIGPMVNHPVICEVEKTRSGNYNYRDIQIDE